MSLPNGEYKFFALGYSLANLKGQLFCGKAGDGATFTLGGGAKLVSLNLSVANCNSSYFSGSSAFHSGVSPYDFNPTKILSCSNSFAVNSASSGSVCTSSKGNINAGGSVKLVLLGYASTGSALLSQDVSEAGGISSDCIKGSGMQGNAGVAAVGVSAGYQGVAVHGDNTIIFGGQSGEMLRSTDNGLNYATTPTAGADNRTIKSDGTTIVMSSTTGVWISTDGGASYTQRQSGTAFWGIDVYGSKVVAGQYTAAGNVFVSTDSGITYTSYVSGVGASIEAIHFVPSMSEQMKKHAQFSAQQGMRLKIVSGGKFVGAAKAQMALSLSAAVSRGTALLPAGGSSPIGVLGHVNAVFELARQIRAGEIPEPDLLVVGVGTCGTMAGLLAGIKLTGLKTKVIGVRCVDPIFCNPLHIALLANGALKILQSNRRIRSREIDLRDPSKNVSYGQPLPNASELVKNAWTHCKVELDTTYTTKVFVYLQELARAQTLSGLDVLYWHTYSPAATRYGETSVQKLFPATA